MTDTKKTETAELENPGQVVTNKTLTLHTKEALKIFKGREANAEKSVRDIPGIPVYASFLKVIWGDCWNGNLYAKYWIQKLEKSLGEAEKHLISVKSQLDNKSASRLKQISLSNSEATHPVDVEINFASPYTYKIIYLLIQLDEIVAQMINLRHIAIINPVEFEASKREAVSSIQKVLNGLRGYSRQGITLEDIEAKNAKALEAISAMGELPQDILDGSYHPEQLPRMSKALDPFLEQQLNLAKSG